ncbi:TIGR04219 family outer membrane beta-barrel protein [Rheinheimera muenzenbergensis]|uniref:TIGR04219 family outer membrane beta-barrel protein n=1 Tax=Rheinheimera muenzenbergensis TaxID=1193628 RepID=A0ABU8C4I6_9GAMM
MKKTALLLSLSTVLLAGTAQADTLLGIYLGADAWQSSAEGSFAATDMRQSFNFNDKTQTSYYLTLEHPLPLLPNVRLQRNQLTSAGISDISAGFTLAGATFASNTEVSNQLELSNTDYVLYYELFDNSLLSLDLGINAKHIKGHVLVTETAADGMSVRQNISQIIPMLYTSAAVGLPLTGLEFFAGGSIVSYDGSRVYDGQAGISYAFMDNLVLDTTLKLGYRAVNMRLDDVDDLYADLTFNGVFAGIEIHF